MKSDEPAPTVKARLAVFLIPLLAVLIPLYQALTNLGIAVTHTETVLIVATLLGGAAAVGLLAALAPERLRVLVLALCTLFILDLSIGMGKLFDGIAPASRVRSANDATRVADLHRIQEALEMYMVSEGPVPHPSAYGESNVSPTFWNGWWDLSTVDRDKDGKYFLDFLLEREVVPSVPVDPQNEPLDDNRDPMGGKRYVYFVSPGSYKYQGGSCVIKEKRPVYMLAITDLESALTRPPKEFQGSGCKCLWLDSPGFFEEHFDYILCGAGAAITSSATVPAKGRLSVAETEAARYLLGAVRIRSGEGADPSAWIELLSAQGVAAVVSGESFLQSGSLMLRRDGHAVLSGGVVGGEELSRYRVSTVDRALGKPEMSAGEAGASLRFSLQSPGRITEGRFSLGLRDRGRRTPARSTLQVVEEGKATSGAITSQAADDGRSLQWSWKPGDEKTRNIEVTIHFPYGQIDLESFEFLLKVENGAPYWEVGDSDVAVRNATGRNLEVEWIAVSRL